MRTALIGAAATDSSSEQGAIVPSGESREERLLDGFLAFCAFLAATSPDYSLLPQPLRLTWPSIVLLCAISAAVRWKAFARALDAARPLLAISAWSAVTVLWSDRPATSLDGTVQYLSSALVAVYISSRFGLVRALAVASFALLVGLVFSALAVIRSEGSALTSLGAWSGIFGTQAQLGLVAGLAVLTVGVRTFVESVRWRRRIGVLLCLESGAILWASQSGAAIAATVTTGVLLLACTAMLRMRRGLRVSISFAAICMGILLLHLDSERYSLFGGNFRDITISQYGELWSDLVMPLQRKTLIGHGYQAVWPRSDLTAPVTERLSGPPSSAHNGYIDTMLQTGVVGLVLILAPLLAFVLTALRGPQDRLRFLSGLAVISFVLTFNALESTFLRPLDITWMLTLVVFTRFRIESSSAGSVRELSEGIEHRGSAA